MNFDHPLLVHWIPTKINMTRDKYEKFYRRECKTCKYNRFKLDVDIFFDVFYYLKENSLSNIYHYNEGIKNLCERFQCHSSDLLSKAKLIGLPLLVEICTYHSVWLHNFIHWINKNELSGRMEEWDSMYQGEHVCAKNEIHILIYLLLICDPERKSLMKEIKDFTLCPPIKPNGICGFKYKEIKTQWEEKVKNQIS
jgi:hypothetical protein